MKNLKDFLQTLESDSIVAIGTEKGNGFIYIGKAGNTELINKCFDDCLTAAYERADRYESRLKYLILTPPTMGKNQKEINKLIYNHASSIHDLVSAITHNNCYIDTYKPALKRVVKDKYHKDVDDCMAIIIEGTDNGRFWTKAEFDKKH